MRWPTIALIDLHRACLVSDEDRSPAPIGSARRPAVSIRSYIHARDGILVFAGVLPLGTAGEVGGIEMRNLRRQASRAGCVALLCAASTTWAQDTMRVRGTIERVDGHALAVKSRDGAELKVGLTDNVTVLGIAKASLADIKPGTFVGVTALPQPDGSQKAVEVHIFPEAMRGTGEGHYPWDLQPQSTMTNANVEQMVTGVNGPTLTMRYKDGEKKITVSPDTPIVTYVPADKSELRPGAKIFIAAAKKMPDGTLQAARVNVGKDGLTPPM
jgi:hypothetical protein